MILVVLVVSFMGCASMGKHPGCREWKLGYNVGLKDGEFIGYYKRLFEIEDNLKKE